MDVTVRNVDDSRYRHLKARAALMRKSIGELVSEAIGLLLSMPHFEKKGVSFGELPSFPMASKDLARQVDELVYGSK